MVTACTRALLVCLVAAGCGPPDKRLIEHVRSPSGDVSAASYLLVTRGFGTEDSVVDLIYNREFQVQVFYGRCARNIHRNPAIAWHGPDHLVIECFSPSTVVAGTRMVDLGPRTIKIEVREVPFNQGDPVPFEPRVDPF